MTALHEWPLVFFTLMVQLAVGLHLGLLALYGPRGARLPSSTMRPWSQRPSLFVGILMAVALTFSLLHLGTPLNAVHTLSNLEDSWLSREILATLLFLGLWGSGFWMGRRPEVAAWKARALAWASAVAGIVLILAMARIYMVPARPLWDHWLTPASFFLSTLLLGATALAAYVEHPSLAKALPPAWGSLSRSILIPSGLGAALAQGAVTLAHPLTAGLLTSPPGRPLVILRLLLLLVGALFLVIPLTRRSPPETHRSLGARNGPWLIAALLLMGVSEVLGRMLFYSAGTLNPF